MPWWTKYFCNCSTPPDTIISRGRTDRRFMRSLFENKETFPRTLQHTSPHFSVTRIASYATPWLITSQGEGTMETCKSSVFKLRIWEFCTPSGFMKSPQGYSENRPLKVIPRSPYPHVFFVKNRLILSQSSFSYYRRKAYLSQILHFSTV